jgi:hypothetical protein
MPWTATHWFHVSATSCKDCHHSAQECVLWKCGYNSTHPLCNVKWRMQVLPSVQGSVNSEGWFVQVFCQGCVCLGTVVCMCSVRAGCVCLGTVVCKCSIRAGCMCLGTVVCMGAVRAACAWVQLCAWVFQGCVCMDTPVCCQGCMCMGTFVCMIGCSHGCMCMGTLVCMGAVKPACAWCQFCMSSVLHVCRTASACALQGFSALALHVCSCLQVFSELHGGAVAMPCYVLSNLFASVAVPCSGAPTVNSLLGYQQFL